MRMKYVAELAQRFGTGATVYNFALPHRLWYTLGKDSPLKPAP
jgi:hypothetical protein